MNIEPEAIDNGDAPQSAAPSSEVVGHIVDEAVEEHSRQPTFIRAHSRHEKRKMEAQIKRAMKPKRGFTKPLHDKAKRQARNKMQRASRRINRIHAEQLKQRV